MHLRKFFFTFTFLIFLKSTYVYSQIDSSGYVELDTFHSRKDEFSIGINIGFGKLVTMPNLRNKNLANTNFHYENLRLNYTYRVRRKLGLDFASNIGYYPVYFVIPEEEYFLFRFYENMAPLPRISLEPSVRYAIYEHKKSAFEIKAGLIFTKLIFERGSLGNTIKGNGGLMLNTEVNYITNPNWIIGTNIGVSYLKKLHNRNALEFNLNYQFMGNNFYTGTYSVKENGFNTSLGNIYSTGNGITLTMMYIFTGIAKQDLKVTYINNKPTASKKELKNFSDSVLSNSFNRESIDIGFTSGITISNSKVLGSNTKIKSANAIGTSYSLSVQKNYQNENFAEYGLAFVPYNIGFKVQEIHSNCILCGSFSESFAAIQNSIAMGRKFFNKRKKQLFFIKAGGSISFITSSKGLSGKSSLKTEISSGTLEIQTENYQTGKVFMMLSAMTGREFRITENTLFLIGYQYHLGFNSLYSMRGWQTLSSIQSDVNIEQTGSYHQLVLGLRYRLFR